MNKIIQVLAIMFLTVILVIAVVFAFNPLNLRNYLVGAVVNGYLANTQLPANRATTTEGSKPTTGTKPLLNAEQINRLKSYGVDTSKLPTSISPAMQKCFVDKLGQTRADEIVKGSAPSLMEIFNIKNCLGQ